MPPSDALNAPSSNDAPRIVSLLPSATEIVAALGLESALVGRSHECDFPEGVSRLPACTESMVDARAGSEEIHRSVSELLARSLSVYRVDAERLRALGPTHVVTQVQCEVCAVSLSQVADAMADWVGATTPGERVGDRPELVALDASSLEGVFEDVRRVGAALSVSKRAEKLVAAMRSRIREIGDAATGAPNRPRVAAIEWLSPLMTAGNWMPELIEIAGRHNLFGEAGRHSPRIAWSDVVAADPDVVLVFPCGFPLERSAAEAGLLRSLPGWERLRAARAGQVYLCEGNQYFNRPGPRLVETLEILAEVLHPSRFAFGHEGEAWMRLDAAKPAAPSRPVKAKDFSAQRPGRAPGQPRATGDRKTET